MSEQKMTHGYAAAFDSPVPRNPPLPAVSREGDGPRPPAPWAAWLWRVATSPVTFVALALLWCLDLGVGSLFAYNEPRVFGSLDAYPFGQWLDLVGRKALPDSLWVYLLVSLSWLMVFSLLLCTGNWFFRRRKRMRGVGEVLIHLGFLLIFAGFVIGSATGTRVQGINIPEGKTAELPQLGLALRLDKLDPVVTPDGQLADTRSQLSILAPAGAGPVVLASGLSRTNHPVIWGPTVVYSRDAFIDERGTLTGVFDIHRDPGVWWVIVGGIILGLGTLWSLLGYLGILPGIARE
jgi:hypothetical protein